MLARTTAATTMPSAAPVQRKAILLSIIAVRTVLPVRSAIALLRLLMLRLTAGDERGQAVDVVTLIFRSRMLRPRLEMRLLMLLLLLWLIVRLIVLLILLLIVLLIVMLLTRMIRLRLAWGERLAAEVWLLAIAVVVALIGPAHLAGLLLLVIGLTLAELLLRRGDDAEIVLGMLVVILRRDRIAGALRITSELQIFFGDVGRGSADFYVRPVRFIRPR